MEEENSSSLRDYDYNAPGKVQVKTGKLSRLDYCWVYIIAKNEYGSAEWILEFPPHYPFNDSNSMEIVCDDISEDRTLSAYLQHTFKVENRDFSISNPEWTLSLPLNDGSFEYVSLADEAFSCTAGPIDNSSNYKISQEGIMETMLQFKGSLDDVTTIYVHCPINFHFKPFIEYAVIERIEDEAPSPSYNAYYKVKYYGSDQIRVYVEEENRSEVKLSYLNEPYIAYGCASHITAPYKAWIDFVVENDYGKDTYTIELLPYGEVANSVDSIIDETASSESTGSLIEVYDVNGRKIADINDISEAYRLPAKGLLILKEPHRTRKIMVR